MALLYYANSNPPIGDYVASRFSDCKSDDASALLLLIITHSRLLRSRNKNDA